MDDAFRLRRCFKHRLLPSLTSVLSQEQLDAAMAIACRHSAERVRTPIFLVPGSRRWMYWWFAQLARLLGQNQSGATGYKHEDLDGKEAPFTQCLRWQDIISQKSARVRPNGPYIILGSLYRWAGRL